DIAVPSGILAIYGSAGTGCRLRPSWSHSWSSFRWLARRWRPWLPFSSLRWPGTSLPARRTRRVSGW
ncbi:unnamed protein product, partial [Symbiodinium sp. CCMP2456]